MRQACLAVFAAALLLTGCGTYNQVNQGERGPTSPAESGQHGAYADQIASQSLQSAETEVYTIEHPITNDETDPSMEGSGNIAAQGNYKQVEQQIEKSPTPPIQ